MTSKLQDPRSKIQGSSNPQVPTFDAVRNQSDITRARSAAVNHGLKLGRWSLELGCSLVLGVWSLELPRGDGVELLKV
jgi:hypothetical protein